MADLSRSEQLLTVLRSTWSLDWEPQADEYTSPPFVRRLLATDRYVATTPMGLRIGVYLNRDPNMRTCWFVRTRVDGCNEYPLDLWTDTGDIDATDPASNRRRASSTRTSPTP